MKVFLYTLGCKLNQCESEAIADAFVREGFSLVKQDDGAQLYIVNTCTVTGKAEQKARRMIRKFASEEQRPVVLVTGCYAQMERELIEELGTNVVVVSLDDKPSLLGLPEFLANRLMANIDLLEAIQTFVTAANQKKVEHSNSPFDYNAATFSLHSRAFLKIQDGCDNACAYCRVTIARGSAKSLPAREVLQRVLALEHEGFSEIVLTGVNISAYSSENYGLGGLLKLLLDQLGKNIRIRLSSLEPDTIDEELLSIISDNRIQPHFHLPVQSCSDVVLHRVNRNYPIEKVRTVVNQLRSVKDDPFIAADMITGLPAETDEEFHKSLAFLREMEFSQLHVFPFSPRPQTALFDAKDRVPEGIRDARAKMLRELSAIQTRRYIDRQLGKHLELLVEEKRKGSWTGVTGNYLKLLVVDPPESLKRGDTIIVEIQYNTVGNHPVGKYLSFTNNTQI
jgi:threonylcarbamoyladenosine tRNA methylthiotransferase MtaB